LLKKRRIDRITFYDFSDLNYSSFFLTGFLENSEEFGYQMSISRKTPELLAEMKLSEEWRNILSSIILFCARIEGDDFFFCIDARDSNHPDIASGYHLPLINQVKIYFKVNFSEATVNDNQHLQPFKGKIVPVPLVFPLRPPKPWLFWPRAFPSSGTRWPLSSSVRRFKTLLTLRSLDQLRALRGRVKDIDLFFLIRFYENVHPDLNQSRCTLIREIRKRKLNAITGLLSEQKLPDGFDDLRVDSMWHSSYLRLMSQARIGLYVRGVHDCLSFKLGELLALGLPIVGEKLRNNEQVLYKNEYFEEQFCFESPERIAEEVCKLLKEPERQRKLSQANIATFESHYTPKLVVSDILRHLSGSA
jgi:hypothetical protein